MAFRSLILFVLSLLGLAAVGPDETKLRQQLAQYQVQTDFTPAEAYNHLAELLGTIDQEKSPALWADYVLALAGLENNSNLGTTWSARIDTVLRLTEKLSLKPQRLHALLARATLDGSRRPHAEVLKLYKEATDLCEELKEPLSCNHSWRDMAYYNYVMRDYPLALMAMQRALGFLDQKNPEHEAAIFDTKNYLAIIFAAVGDFAKARPLYEEAIAYAHRNGDAYQEMVVEYNLASGFVQNLSRYTPDLAREHFENALALARSLKNPDLIGWILGGLGEFQAKSGEPDKALPMLDEASRLMPKDLWVRQAANVEKTRARALVRLKRYAESQKAVEKALVLLPKEAVEDQNEILSIQYEIAIGQDRKIDALYLLQKFHESVVNLTQDREKRQLQTLQASIGLQAEEQRSAELREKNRVQALELEKTERLRRLFMVIAGLSLLAGGSLLAVLFKDRQVKRQKENLQHILDSIQEGILRIGGDSTIAGHASQHSAILFETKEDLQGMNICDLLFEPGDTKSQVQAALQSMLNEDAIAWEFNHGLLPHEIVRRGRQLSLHWHPVLRHNRLQEVILTARDVTDLMHFQEQLRREKDRHESLVEGLMEIMSRKPEQALSFIHVLPGKIPEWEQQLDRLEGRARLRADIHTLKGNSRMLGLKSYAELFHTLEGELQEQDLHPQQLRNALFQFRDAVEQRDRTFASLFQQGSLAELARRGLWDLCGAIFQDLRLRLRSEALTIGHLECRDAVDDWSGVPLDALRDILVHACNNAIDHGYLLPIKQGRNPSPIGLAIEAKRDAQEHLVLRIIDHGVGLNWERIQSIAAQKQFTARAGRPLSDVLFLPDVSTAHQLTLTSGRGVGLAAIAALCQDYGGDCQLTDREGGSGTELRIELPTSLAKDLARTA